MPAGLAERLETFTKNELNNLDLASIEETYKTYLTVEDGDLPDIDALSETLAEAEKTLSIHENKTLANAVKASHPHQHILLTQALLYLITTYGLTEINGKYYVNAQAINLLRNPTIFRLAKEKQHFLVYAINQAIEARNEDTEKAETIEIYRKAVNQLTYLNDDEKERCAQAVTDFFYYIDNPLEDENRLHELEKLLAVLLDEQKQEKAVILWLHGLAKANDWFFLKTIYDYYNSNGRTLAEVPNALGTDIANVHTTCVAMDKKTNRQKLGMAGGGAFIGIGVAMLALENLALMSSLGPLAVLGVAAASAVFFGGLMGLFFLQAHLNELKAQNRINYFKATYEKANTQPLPPGARTALSGVGVEGCLIIVEALTITGLIADMITWEVVGGTYDVTLPGMFFATQAPIALPIVLGVIALAAICWVAYCLSSGHYSLDGNETIEYCTEKQKERRMRNVIDREPGQQTFKPLYFSNRMQMTDKLTSFKHHQPTGYQSVNGSPVRNVSPQCSRL